MISAPSNDRVAAPVTRAHRRRFPWATTFILAVGIGYLALFLLFPLGVIFHEALRKGWHVFARAITDKEAVHALRMTLLSAIVAVPINTIFGVCAAWAIAKFRFPFKRALLALIDLPITVSPVIAGMVLILLYGAGGWFGGWIEAQGVKIIFAKPGVILATTFVTIPFVVRELVPLMQAQGSEEEQAALLLGASGWQMFWRVTLPNIKWALFHGVVLCQARALGEFGAASVVSGNVRGETNTLSIHIQIQYDDYQTAASFACAALLTLVALAAIILKKFAHPDPSTDDRR